MRTSVVSADAARPALVPSASPFDQMKDHAIAEFEAQFPSWKVAPFSVREVRQTTGLANGLWALKLTAQERLPNGTLGPRRTFNGIHVPIGNQAVRFSMEQPAMNRSGG